MKIVNTFFLILNFILVYGQAPKQPHIVFFLADDLGWNDVSFHGSKQIPTPNIDVLAKDGVILNSYYVSKVCTPSRAAFMTSKYPLRIGLQHSVIEAFSPWGLPLEETLFPQYLKSLNYSTYGVGKWHLGFFKKDYIPVERGFDSFFGYWSGSEDYFTHIFEDLRKANMTGLDLHDNYADGFGYDGIYGTELFTNKAKDVIRHHNPSKPMFLYVSQQAPHSGAIEDPIQVPRKYYRDLVGIKDESRRKFAGMVTALDYSVGEIFEALEKAHMLDNTIFIFSSDNGGSVEGLEGVRGSNYPLRGTKITLWEGGIRVAAFIWSPLLRKVSRIATHLMHITDWMPTLLSAIGADTSVLSDIDGINQWQTILNNAPSGRNEILHNIDPVDDTEAIRFENYKLVKGTILGSKFDGWFDQTGQPINGSAPKESILQKTIYKQTYKRHLRKSKAAKILKKKYGKSPSAALQCDSACKKLLEVKCPPRPSDANNCKPTEAPCLFDIQKDPCEFYNIADQHPDIVTKLEEELDRYRSEAIAPLNQPLDPAANPKFHGNVWKSWR